MNMEKDDLATANLQTAFLHIQAKERKVQIYSHNILLFTDLKHWSTE